MDATGTVITFETVAREAGVSRSWLYSQQDLRAEIERLRARHSVPAARPVIDRQRASDASLLRRLEVATERSRQLGADTGSSGRRWPWRSVNAVLLTSAETSVVARRATIAPDGSSC
ncbi:hypothetical protein [Streptomyces sp. NPDC051219]|uniref:hypothetical protein n=1 Tax=Streptomyces sp. NPDC051219 TaxID=3155283 RepID=UPI00342EBF00